MAQTKNYTIQWSKIIKAEEEGNLKSLEPKVDAIYIQAKQEKNSQQKIKALLYLSRIKWTTADDVIRTNKEPSLEVFNNFETDVKASTGVEKALLQNYLAEMYATYRQGSRWGESNVSNTESKPEDFRTWSNAQFESTIDSLYEASLKNKDILQQAKTNDWSEILTQEDTDALKPTLYDLLANNYITHLIDNQFTLSDREEKNNNTKIDQLYQSLLDLHQDDANKSAYLNYKSIVIKRQYASDLEQRRDALLQLINKNDQEPYTAQLLYDLANEYTNTFGTGKADYVKSRLLCLRAINEIPKSKWNIRCKNLLAEIELQRVETEAYTCVNPDEAIPIQIAHKNVDEFTLEIYDISPAPYSEKGKLDEAAKDLSMDRNRGIYKSIFYEELKPIRKLKVKLKHFSDYDTHTTIYKIDGLKKGVYKIVAKLEDKKNEEEDNNTINVGKVLAIVRDQRGENYSYQLLDKNTGKAIRMQHVLFFEEKQGYIEQTASCKTDEEGILKFSKRTNNQIIYIPLEKEFLYLNPYNYSSDYYSSEDSTVSHNIKFFSDRAIYRPGQTVYFKGILSSTQLHKTKIDKNKKVKITLRNANDETVSSLELISNDYGSVFGEFVLPSSGITGSFALSSDIGSNNYRFSVEEYKRPKFEVKFDKLDGEYILDKNIEMKGFAKAFSGAAITDAKIKYRVTRQEVHLWHSWGCGWLFPHQPQIEEIAHGDLVTDSEGRFTINFLAKSNKEHKAKEYRSYVYTAHVDVTDINGETHSNETIITIGDLPKKLELHINTPSLQSEFKNIVLTSTTLNGSKTPSKGELKITRLDNPNRILLPNRQLDADYQLYDYNTFISYFPHLRYKKDETNPSNFEKKEVIFSSSFDTEKSDSITLNQKLDKGYYLVEAYTMFGTDSIQTYKTIEIQDDKTQKSSDNIYFQASLDKNSYKVGDSAILTLTTDAKDGYVNIEQERDRKLNPIHQIELENGVAKLTFNITESDLKNGIFLNTDFVKWGDFSYTSIHVPIVRAKKNKLKIETKVFRDKIEPGKKEEWVLHISGTGKDTFVAELLASMYDASLDQFASNDFNSNFDIQESQLYPRLLRRTGEDFYVLGEKYYLALETSNNNSDPEVSNPQLNWFNFSPVKLSVRRMYKGGFAVAPMASDANIKIRGNSSMSNSQSMIYIVDGVQADTFNSGDVASMNVLKSEEATAIYGKLGANGVIVITTKKGAKQAKEMAEVKTRTNLKETAFFFPNLYTDVNGDIKLTFTTPESLSKWKLLLFAHNKDLECGSASYFTRTQKELMVVPNVPRFLREGDKITISTKINNLSDQDLNGNASLMLFDAITNKPVDSLFVNTANIQHFSITKGKNTEVNWNISVPKMTQAVTYRIVAKAGNFSDGEENILPILSNRLLVTETLPISIREGGDKTFKFDKLIDNKSNTLQNFSLTMELTTNPTWLAVMSLPYLREYPYECSEQLFARLYGNLLSTSIINSSPKIKRVFDAYNTKGLTVSKLERNQDLKNILLEETPWLHDGQSEKEQMQRLSLFFDLNKMSNELNQAQEKLIKRQTSKGGFAWFEGGQEDTYITGHIVAGFGKLRNLLGKDQTIYLAPEQSMIKKAIDYLDTKAIESYNESKKNKSLNSLDLTYYFYVRSYWLDKYKIPSKLNSILKKNLDTHPKYDLQRQAMVAIILQRYGRSEEAKRLIRELKEKSVESDEMGMYWKTNISGWYWYQSPVETQAFLIEAFAEVTPKDIKCVEEMKVWLLKNRQTNAWQTTKATTEAIYALLHYGKSWVNAEEGITATMGNEKFYPAQNSTIEQASGYIKQVWTEKEVKPEMGTLHISKTSPGVAWGGMYWQYFDTLDKIGVASSDVKIQKQLFLKINTDNGSQLQEIKATHRIKVGNLVTIRLVIKTDRDMQYIHIKDMRASGFEPINVLSQYKWQNGIAYYENTRDASSNFFISYLPKGVYVFEYDVRANNVGDFSNGITTFQSMYAPEMSAHSEGIRVKIEH